MPKPSKKYEPGMGGKRIVVEVDENELKEFETVRKQVKTDTGVETDKATVLTAIKHYARHVERGDFEK